MTQFKDLPLFSKLITNAAEQKDVYYFSTDKINSSEPHNFVCIRKDDDFLVFLCTTSQEENKKKYFKRKGYPLNTLVKIPLGSSELPFKKDTYINCNDYTPFTIKEFDAVCKKKEFKNRGTLEDVHFQNIINGLHASDELDDDFKESLPPKTI